jgi:hypothetical protein
VEVVRFVACIEHVGICFCAAGTVARFLSSVIRIIGVQLWNCSFLKLVHITFGSSFCTLRDLQDDKSVRLR